METSIMDISMSMNLTETENDINFDEISVVHEKMDWLNILMESFEATPTLKSATDKLNSRIKVAEGKLINLEREVQELERRSEVEKDALNIVKQKLKSVKEELHKEQMQLSRMQKEIQEVSENIIQLKEERTMAEKENPTEKWKIDIYHQLTGVWWSSKPSSPNELRGYAASRGPLKSIKTFQFNLEENSTSFIGDYVWNVLKELRGNSWETVGKPADK